MRALVVLLGFLAAISIVTLLVVTLGSDDGGPAFESSGTDLAELRQSIDSLRQSIDRLSQLLVDRPEPAVPGQGTAAPAPAISGPELREVVADSVRQALQEAPIGPAAPRLDAAALRALYEEKRGQTSVSPRTLGATRDAAERELLLLDYSAVLQKLGVPMSISGDETGGVRWWYEGGTVYFHDGLVIGLSGWR
ncbi:MAG: hypothetical protein HY812_03945 [Planctomycetes bacterium]|nr:hypothetical protein [Planctomycetota bacterium]